MVNISNKDIYMTKGDTVRITLDIRDKDGNEYVIRSGDVIRMVVKNKRLDKDIIIIESTTKDLVIESDMTSKIIPGNYEYDVQITFNNGDINTIVPKHKFVILQEVS